MYPIGHIGVALVATAPVVFALRPRVATRFTVVTVLGATLPDLDALLPYLGHHGITHTLEFGIGVGVAACALSLFVSAVSPSGDPSRRRSGRVLVLYGVGLALGAVSHVLADAAMVPGLRPAGPLWALAESAVPTGSLEYGNTARNVGAFLVALVAHAAAVDAMPASLRRPFDRESA